MSASRRVPGVRRLAAAAVALLAAAPALAFHSGGAARCEGCHTMHGSATKTSGSALVQGADASSTCLLCHAGVSSAPHSVLSLSVQPGAAPLNMTPGGDFAWLTKSWSWAGTAGLETSPGDAHGHNVVAADYGRFADPRHPTAPGGSYPSNQLSCISCHDPHGKYRVREGGVVATGGAPIVASGSYGDRTAFATPSQTTAIGTYRMLAGVGYQPRTLGGVNAFSADPPVALAPGAYNQGERIADVRVAYGSGMSEWCGNCHGAIHTPANPTRPGEFMHPSGSSAKLGMLANVYNAYVKTGDLGGSYALAYTSLVPYEEGTADRATLAASTSSDGMVRTGPVRGQENVMCLSCHRAHASGWDGSLRWNVKSEYVVAGGQWPGIDAIGEAGRAAVAQGRTRAETRGAMYDREPTAFASFQTSLCNKCHAK
ncbi:cytochrome c family protein [Anaeromyxobacter dehalogenans 2CP-1]|uniref:Cytochrome c family protein n=2 Tax=Anaeromyxobacter dehalogenans TaxID=161493 RepID=B8JGV4_ANAD2|nr:cytochrome c family protein [Anaeromyxobacter dehalogenans 2CP-1]